MSVVVMRGHLTEGDVRALVKGDNDAERAAAAYKIALTIDYAELSDQERAYAEAIVRIIAEDAAVRVRQALAQTLRQSKKLPSDVAVRLAKDVDAISLPILENSPMLADRDLIEILRSAPPIKQVAIAGRPQLSKAVTAAIAEHGAEAAVTRALANEGALFADDSLHRVIERLSDREQVLGAMSRRRKLPVGVVEKLVSLVTGEVFDYLVNQHELPPQLAIDIAAGARERATIDLAEQAARQSDLKRFVQQLFLHGRLTPSLMIRAACLGHIAFIEHALAEFAGIEHSKAWRLVHDAGPLGLKALFDRSGLPPKLFPPFRTAVDLAHQLEQEGVTAGGDGFRQRMVERALTNFRSLPKDDLDYLLDKLDAVKQREAVAAPGM